MKIIEKLARLRISRLRHNAVRSRRRTQLIAYRLYRKRVRKDLVGSKDNDWYEAEHITQNIFWWNIYNINQMLRTILMPLRWCFLGVKGKSSWEWLELLIIPLFLAIGAFYLESQVERRQERIAQERYEQDLQIATQKAKQEVLANYIERMQELLLDGGLRQSEERSEVRSIARAITTIAIKELDYERNILLIDFLQESRLLGKTEEENNESNRTGISLLAGLDLRNSELTGVNLINADLRGTTLAGADLESADLSGSDLSNTSSPFANFKFTNFSGANLTGAYFGEANLAGAIFIDANLSEVSLLYRVSYNRTFSQSIFCRTILPESLPERLKPDSNRDCRRISQMNLATGAGKG